MTTAPAYPTPGRIVHYMLTAADAEAINRRREHAVESGIMAQNSGATLWAASTVYGGDEPEPGQWTWPVIR